MGVESILTTIIPQITTAGVVVHSADKLLYRDKKGKVHAPRKRYTDIWASEYPQRGNYYVYGRLGRGENSQIIKLGSRRSKDTARNLAKQMKKRYGVK